MEVQSGVVTREVGVIEHIESIGPGLEMEPVLRHERLLQGHIEVDHYRAVGKWMPDSNPTLPGDGAKKHAGLSRLNGSLEPVYELQPATTPMRAGSVMDPVMFWLPAP
jgi:hypothetical protein